MRSMVEANGTFVEIYLSTPIEECERRDTKGLYAKARRNEIQNFTGVNDPYEIPENPELIFDTLDVSPEEITDTIIEYLKERNIV